MANHELRAGPTGEHVRRRVAETRRAQGLSLRALSERLERHGWPLSVSVLSKIETGVRRIDVDDLVALAVAFDVPVSSLLLPPADSDPEGQVSLTPRGDATLIGKVYPRSEVGRPAAGAATAETPLTPTSTNAWPVSPPKLATPPRPLRATFADQLSPDALDALEQAGEIRRYRTGETLLHEGGAPTEVLLLRRGRVKVMTGSPVGGETLLAVRGPGDLIGEVAAIDGSPRSAAILALENVEALAVPTDRFRRFLREFPTAAALLLGTVISRLRAADRQRVTYQGQDARARLATLLVELVDRYGFASPHGTDQVIDVPLSQLDLAAAIDASRESVARTIAAFRAAGILDTARRTIRIRDLKALRAEAARTIP